MVRATMDCPPARLCSSPGPSSNRTSPGAPASRETTRSASLPPFSSRLSSATSPPETVAASRGVNTSIQSPEKVPSRRRKAGKIFAVDDRRRIGNAGVALLRRLKRSADHDPHRTDADEDDNQICHQDHCKDGPATLFAPGARSIDRCCLTGTCGRLLCATAGNRFRSADIDRIDLFGLDLQCAIRLRSDRFAIPVRSRNIAERGVGASGLRTRTIVKSGSGLSAQRSSDASSREGEGTSVKFIRGRRLVILGNKIVGMALVVVAFGIKSHIRRRLLGPKSVLNPADQTFHQLGLPCGAVGAAQPCCSMPLASALRADS